MKEFTKIREEEQFGQLTNIIYAARLMTLHNSFR